MAYCTVAQVKTWKSITSTDDDALLEDVIAQAQAAIDAYCSTTFEATSTAARTFDAVADVDGPTLNLDRPLASITSIVNGDSTTLTAADYVTEPRNDAPYRAIRLKASSGKYWTYTDDPEDAITVTGSWAYSVTAPDNVVQATVVLTAWMYDMRDAPPQTMRAQVSPDGTVLLPTAWPHIVRDLLAPYRRFM